MIIPYLIAYSGNCSAEKDIMWQGISFMEPVTTTVIKWDDNVVIRGGEIRPGVRSPVFYWAK